MSHGNGLNVPELNDNYLNYLNDPNDVPVFDRRTVITVQPFAREEISQRCPLPVSTVGRVLESSVPFNGVRMLFDVDEVTIEQTYELHDLLTVIQSENRYFIKSGGEIVFGGIEESLPLQRLCCASNRKFTFRLFDRSRQEALYFTRRLAFINPTIGCCWLQKVDVFVPPTNYLGSIIQQLTPCKTTLCINNSENQTVYFVVGPTQFICPIFKETSFIVYDTNSEEVGTIGNVWDTNLMNYKLTVKFPNRACTPSKALLLVCGILLEYMFFESANSGGWCRCVTCHR